ncbi:DUF554 domain-containing protein [Allisonella histaminiformans]|uniref:DUF554 domain-containing protein n=1 Tax=Allisonella histaminiformans TaxID=209880 RepID=UPI002942E108|nr:DUF554 domain-containing protein [Allisonella histaminiformans]
MFAVIVNTLAIAIASLIGLCLRRGMTRNITDAVMQALGICTVLIGIQGAVSEKHVLLLIISVVIGVIIGEWGDWDGHVNRWAEKVTVACTKSGDAAGIANAFVTSCLIMNVGAMVIVGSLAAGLAEDYTMLYTKSLLDFVSGIMLSAAMGIGVMGSAVFTLIFQGGIVLLAQYIAPFCSPLLIEELSHTGSLLILAIGLNMIGLTKFKVLNYVPALLVIPFALWISGFASAWL